MVSPYQQTASKRNSQYSNPTPSQLGKETGQRSLHISKLLDLFSYRQRRRFRNPLPSQPVKLLPLLNNNPLRMSMTISRILCVNLHAGGVRARADGLGRGPDVGEVGLGTRSLHAGGGGGLEVLLPHAHAHQVPGHALTLGEGGVIDARFLLKKLAAEFIAMEKVGWGEGKFLQRRLAPRRRHQRTRPGCKSRSFGPRRR